MSTTQKLNFDKLGIIAGKGSLPSYLISICKEKNIEPFIVGFEGQTDANIMDNNAHIWAGFGEVIKIINFFKSNNISNLVLIGGIKRPPFKEIKPDLKAVKILAKLVGNKALGDNNILSALKKELEQEGFTLRAMHDFCDDLLISKGNIGKYSPKPKHEIDIELGLKVSQEIGALDIGQSVIVQNGMVIGVEAVEGTDALIKRCADLLQKGGGGVLVKTRKPQQDKSLDMPTIGVDTIINAHKSGLCGIALQADNVIIVDSKNLAKYADKYKMFVSGIPIKNLKINDKGL